MPIISGNSNISINIGAFQYLTVSVQTVLKRNLSLYETGTGILSN